MGHEEVWVLRYLEDPSAGAMDRAMDSLRHYRPMSIDGQSLHVLDVRNGAEELRLRCLNAEGRTVYVYIPRDASESAAITDPVPLEQ